VLHIDRKPFYGSRQASLTFKELLALFSQSSQNSGVYSSTSYRFASSSESSLLDNSRHYTISLCPSIVPSDGTLINALVQSGVSRYGEFRLLDSLGMLRMSGDVRSEWHQVPSTKEDIFKDKGIPLIAKRKLMKMLQFAMGEYEDSDIWRDRGQTNLPEFLRNRFNIAPEFASAIALAVAFSPSHEPVEPAFARLRRYVQSAGRYGKSPFLVGHFGGLGEMAQWFCRSCAVSGGTYMLGCSVQFIRPPEPVDGNTLPRRNGFSVAIEGIPDVFSVSSIIWPDAPSRAPPKSVSLAATSIVRGIVIVDQPVHVWDSRGKKISFGGVTDNVVIAFDPSHTADGSKDESFVTCFLTGYSTMSCPKGQVIIYLSCTEQSTLSRDPEQLLRPYVTALLHSRGDDSFTLPLFELYYRESLTPCDGRFNLPVPRGSGWFSVDESPPAVAALTETGDILALRAMTLFQEVSTYILGDTTTRLPEYMWRSDKPSSR